MSESARCALAVARLGWSFCGGRSPPYILTAGKEGGLGFHKEVTQRSSEGNSSCYPGTMSSSTFDPKLTA